MLPIIFNYYGRTDNGSLLVGAMDVQGEKNTSLYVCKVTKLCKMGGVMC